MPQDIPEMMSAGDRDERHSVNSYARTALKIRAGASLPAREAL